MFRTYNDIADSWESIYTTLRWFGDNSNMLSKSVGPGAWVDPDQVRPKKMNYIFFMHCWCHLHPPPRHQTFYFIIHPCDPTVVICYLIRPCDKAVGITHLVSHSSSLCCHAIIEYRLNCSY